MNKKILLGLSFGLLIGAVSCGEPVYDDFEDSYVEKLPAKSSDGTTFHAFCWTFNQIKENLPYLADSGFKNVLTMPVQQPKNGGSSWWSYYQPLSFSIADNSAIGTKEELKSLCEEAEKYDISILVDVVANHLANINDDELEADGTPKVAPSVESYEPVLYRNRNENVDGVNGITFHHNPHATGSGAETQVYPYGNLPDLNTENPYVQERVLSLLKECIDVGVDGFRFDAAKHIETEKDPDYSSNFWNNTLEVAKTYYHEKTNKDLYAYGEILNTPIGRSFDVYTDHMKITEDGYVGTFKTALTKKDPQKIVDSDVSKSSADNLITWVESHDTYVTATSHYSDVAVAKLWGIISSRKDLGALYLGRPDENLTVGKVGSYAFETEYVACANRFHNRFIGASEYRSVGGEMIYVTERVSDTDQGAYVLNLDKVDSSTKYEVSLPHLDDGNYYDMLTGNRVVVTKHKAKMNFDSSGIAYLTRTNQKPRPRFSITERNALFAKDMDVTVKISNYDEAYYTFNNEETKYELKDETKISIGNHINSENEVKLNIHVKNGDFVFERTFTYTKVSLIEGYVNVFNINPTYLEDYELYMWSWEPGTWSKNYQYRDGILLVDATGMTGFLFALFEKGYVVTTPNEWDSNVIKQSSDVSGKALEQGFYDASAF